jgi:3-aminobutyryl-CoA ammonia-lyase
MTESYPEAKLRIRMSSRDAHYAGNLVDGARILNLFGDVATELTIRYDGDEGLLRAYDQVEFLAPVYSGDFIEVTGKITKVGNTSRKINFEAYKVITSLQDDKHPSACDVLKPPILVAKATGTCVVVKEKQRKNR